MTRTYRSWGHSSPSVHARPDRVVTARASAGFWGSEVFQAKLRSVETQGLHISEGSLRTISAATDTPAPRLPLSIDSSSPR